MADVPVNFMQAMQLPKPVPIRQVAVQAPVRADPLAAYLAAIGGHGAQVPSETQQAAATWLAGVNATPLPAPLEALRQREIQQRGE